MSQQTPENPERPEGTGPRPEGTPPPGEPPTPPAGDEAPEATGTGPATGTAAGAAGAHAGAASDAPRGARREHLTAEDAAAADDDEDELPETYVVPAGTLVTATPSLVARLGAEAFGAFFLVLAGLGVGLYSSFSNTGGGLGVALAFGIAVLAGIVAVGNVSGGHFNPAVTLGACVAGRTPFRDLLPYWVAQVVGGTVAAAVLYLTIPANLPTLLSQGAETASRRGLFSTTANGFGEHSPLSTLSRGEVDFGLAVALLVEVVCTAVFVGVILAATDRRANKAHVPFAVGLTLTVVLLIAAPVTNGSVNPARSFAAAVFSEGWAFGQLWLFWVAPLLGAAIAAFVYRAFAAEPPEDSLFAEDEELVTGEDIIVVDR